MAFHLSGIFILLFFHSLQDSLMGCFVGVVLNHLYGINCFSVAGAETSMPASCVGVVVIAIYTIQVEVCQVFSTVVVIESA